MGDRPHGRISQLFADLYGSEGDARRIMDDLGMDKALIVWRDKPLNFWSQIVELAETTSRVGDLLKLAIAEYGKDRHDVYDLQQEYRDWLYQERNRAVAEQMDRVRAERRIALLAQDRMARHARQRERMSGVGVYETPEVDSGTPVDDTDLYWKFAELSRQVRIQSWFIILLAMLQVIGNVIGEGYIAMILGALLIVALIVILVPQARPWERG